MKKRMKEVILKEVASIGVGVSMSRIKEKDRIYENSKEVRFINPKSICKNKIKDKEIEIVSIEQSNDKVKMTQINDILVKTTSPFDAVLIDKKHEGLLYNSFCINITIQADLIDSSYVFAFLNTAFVRNKLEKRARSYKTTPISKKDIEEIKIPYYDREKQELIGKLYLKTIEKEKQYEELIQRDKDIIEEIIFKEGALF